MKQKKRGKEKKKGKRETTVTLRCTTAHIDSFGAARAITTSAKK